MLQLSAAAIASSIAAALLLASTASVQLTRTQENWLLFNTALQRLEREYQLFMLKAGLYSPSTPSASTNVGEDDKAKSKLFVESTENIFPARPQNLDSDIRTDVNQIPD